MTLLIVDDNAMNRKVLRFTLEAQGFTLFEAADGLEALEVLQTKKVECVVSDILMPRMDGYMLTHTMRKNELLSSIPVILYSSTYDSKADAELAVRAGAVSFIKKPAPPQEILLAIREATKRGPHKAAEQTIPQELEVMKQYSSLLIQKLEDRNIELSRRNEELAHVNEEMQHFNKATVGREMMMIALKREVNALSIELGRKPPYDLSQLEEKK